MEMQKYTVIITILFSNVQRSILKWYNIAIQMEIIFCRCGGRKLFLVVPHSSFHTLFQLVPHHQFRTKITNRCEGSEVPTSGYQHLLQKPFFNLPNFSINKISILISKTFVS